MTALWVLALITLLLILLMLLPVGLKVRYDDAGTTVKVQIGWIRFSVFPRKPKQNQKKKRKKKELSQPTRPPEKKESMHGIRDFQPFIRLALDFLGTLRQKIVVRSLTLHIWYGGKDAAEAAIHYGQAWAVLGVVMPLLDASGQDSGARCTGDLFGRGKHTVTAVRGGFAPEAGPMPWRWH